ncbi:MAG: HIT family protein [Chloroflexi bacterium]|nr:HIT family protein [Chloroflexota bacterium]MCI0889622.1 HIT family protein [Chloroflexota bacterium]
MSEACIFCQIVAGEVEASVAYEDDLTVAFLDLRQFHAGHTLVVPRRHIRDIYGLDEKIGGALMAAISRVAEGVREAFQPDGINIWQSNGAPWQEVFHLHFHILPRWRDDQLLRFAPPSRKRPSRPELDDQAAKIRAALGG